MSICEQRANSNTSLTVFRGVFEHDYVRIRDDIDQFNRKV